MTETDRSNLRELWSRLTGKFFDIQTLIALIHDDGGLDTSNLSDKDIVDLFGGTFSGDWHEPAFSFSELLAFYSVDGNGMLRERTVAWVFSVLALADAIEHGQADLELNFNSFIDGFLFVRKQLDMDETVWLFQRFFR